MPAPIADAAATAEVFSGPGIPLRELEERWKVSRNTVRSRADALGVDIIRVSSTDTRWPSEWIELGDALHEHLQRGGKLVDFPGARIQSPPSTIARTDSSKGQLATVAPEQLLALMQALQPQQPAADPLRRAESLARCADAALVLCNADLAAVLGQGVAGWADGEERYGYRFRRHQQGKQVLWTVERAIAPLPVSASTAITSLSSASSDRRVGFDVASYLAPAAPVVDVPCRTVGERLFVTNRIGS